MFLIAKRSKKYSLSLISEKLKLEIDEIAQILSDVGLDISPSANTLINEEQLDFLCENYALDIHSFQNFVYLNYHALVAHILKISVNKESNTISYNFPKIVNFKIRKAKTLTEHERFFRNQDNFLGRPLKDSVVQNCTTNILEILVNFLEKKESRQKENNPRFSEEDTYDYFKQSDLQTIERDSVIKYKQLKNLLKRIIKGVKKKSRFSGISIFLKRIIPLNLFHTYTFDEDDINRVALNNFSFSNTSICQFREAVFHSINSKILIKNEIRFSGIN
ncbi:hypothetical protein [Emticicia sp.]|uniref:hypothetical protein n=1 Tax=Emticicia sp. TaxID=1930953 RepID=UPI0037535DCA